MNYPKGWTVNMTLYPYITLKSMVFAIEGMASFVVEMFKEAGQYIRPVQVAGKSTGE